MKLIKPSKEINIAYILITLLIICVRDITGASYWLLILPPISYLKMWIIVSYFVHRKRRLKYSFKSFTIPKYNFEGFDNTKVNFSLMMPTKAYKHKRKWYQLFRKNNPMPKFKYTNNEDGSKSWERVK